MCRAHRLLIVVGAAGLVGGACDDGRHRDIGDEINILTRRNDALVPPAQKRLAAYGRLAVPQIETALHTAAPSGRLALFATLEMIGELESTAIFRHFAVYDVTPEVRAACEGVLARWAAGPEPRAGRARTAVARIAEKRARGEGPVLFGGAGTPGVPATIGAPEPVGAKLEAP